MQPQAPLIYAPVIIKLLQGVMYSDDRHWESLQSYLTPIKEYFGKIGLQVQNYDTDGFAYLDQPDDSEDRSEPLPRLTTRHPLSFKVTVLCVLLREQLRLFDSNEPSARRLVLSIEKLRDLLQPFLQEGNNEEKFRREVDSLVKQILEIGFIKRLSGQDENYEVRPILKAKIDAEMLQILKKKLETYAN